MSNSPFSPTATRPFLSTFGHWSHAYHCLVRGGTIISVFDQTYYRTHWYLFSRHRILHKVPRSDPAIGPRTDFGRVKWSKCRQLLHTQPKSIMMYVHNLFAKVLILMSFFQVLRARCYERREHRNGTQQRSSWYRWGVYDDQLPMPILSPTYRQPLDGGARTRRRRCSRWEQSCNPGAVCAVGMVEVRYFFSNFTMMARFANRVHSCNSATSLLHQVQMTSLVMWTHPSSLFTRRPVGNV